MPTAVNIVSLGQYNWPLVILSIVISMFASYVALTMASRVALLRGVARSVWLVIGTFAMGSGIWSMHFTGMLALEMPMAMSYNIPLVIISWIAALLASGFALYIASRKSLSTPVLLGSAFVMGSGVMAMHYIGMAAMRMHGTISYDLWYVILSYIVALVASAAALWLSFHLRATSIVSVRTIIERIGSSIVMGLGVSGLHYVGMYATNVTVDPTMNHDMPSSYNPTIFAIVIGLFTLVILIAALLSSYLDSRFSRRSAELDSLFHNNLDMVFNFTPDGSIQSMNPSAKQLLEFFQLKPEDGLASLQSALEPEEYQRMRKIFRSALQGQPQRYEIVLTNGQGKRMVLSSSCIPIIVGHEIIGIYQISKDITERYNNEKDLRQSEERYRTMLADLSTPLIPISQEVMVLPLVGGLDQRRIEQMRSTLLQSLSQKPAKWLIIDITGVPEIDDEVIPSLFQTTEAVRLLGSRVIVSGFRAQTAISLVSMGINTQGLQTKATLQDGITYAMQNL
jgi:PAS domain S-box-containing protein